MKMKTNRKTEKKTNIVNLQKRKALNVQWNRRRAQEEKIQENVLLTTFD